MQPRGETRDCGERADSLRSRNRIMSLLAHSTAGVINTWGFAYTGGIIGILSVSRLYVKARVEQPSATPGRTPVSQRIAATGPMAILVGGVGGPSLGFGLAGVVDRQLFEDAPFNEVVDECALRLAPAAPVSSTLHDDVDHVISDLKASDAEPAHRAFHAAASSSTTAQQDWNDSIDGLVDALRRADGFDVASGSVPSD